jgi:hypothetical protein
MCDFARICTFVLLTNLDVVHHCLPVVRQPLRYLFTTAYFVSVPHAYFGTTSKPECCSPLSPSCAATPQVPIYLVV